MRLLLPLVLVISLACLAQANIFDDAWGGVTGVFKSVGGSIGSWWDGNAERKCPEVLSVLKGEKDVPEPVGLSSSIWNFIYSCEERYEQGRVDNAAWWGKFGEFIKAMAGLMPDLPV